MAIRFPEIGELFLGRYEVHGVLGSGGMSRVYAATQQGIDRKVAIKVLAPARMETISDADFEVVARRFEREAQIVAKLRSPHTMVMYDYGQLDELLYMILELVEGTTLHELVRAQGALSEERVSIIARQTLASLAEAHEMGILHRDIKPANIMVFEHLGNPDYVKVLDFGIAKVMSPAAKDTQLTAEQTIVGTPSYMSPEQILAGKLEPASDIYSLGLVLYELLFGVVAVEAESNFSTLAHHLSPNPIEIPDDGRISPQMQQILGRMIAKKPSERYQSALELLHELDAVYGGSSLTTPRTGAALAAPRMPTQPHPPTPAVAGTDASLPVNRRLYVTASVLVVAVIAASALAIWLIVTMMDDPSAEVTASPPAALVVAEESPIAPPVAPVEPAAPVEEVAPEEEPPVEVVADEPPPEDKVEDVEEEPAAAELASRKASSRSIARTAKPPTNEPEPVEPVALPEPKKFEPVKPPVTVAAPAVKVAPEKTAKEKEEEAAKRAAAEKAKKKEKEKEKAPAVYSF